MASAHAAGVRPSEQGRDRAVEVNLEGSVLERVELQECIDRYLAVVARWMERHGYDLLRIALSVVFLWFGLLKPLRMSPAEAFVIKATAWIPIPGFLYVLAIWEVAIGVCFLFKRFVGYGVMLLFLHMPGTLLPLITLREDTFVRFPFALSLEGQYIIKNVVLIAAGIVLGGKARLQQRAERPASASLSHSQIRPAA